MSHRRLLVFAASICAAVPALAQNSASHTFRFGRELLNGPQKYVGTFITISEGFCVYDEPSVVCFGSETPFEVKASTVSDPKTLAKLKDKCGDDLPGKEHDPTPFCTFSFSFVPTGVKSGIGDYVLHDVVQSNKHLVLFEADVIVARAR